MPFKLHVQLVVERSLRFNTSADHATFAQSASKCLPYERRDFPENNVYLPVSIQGKHAIMDGVPAGRFSADIEDLPV